jgi:folate-binding protein YgfZ
MNNVNPNILFNLSSTWTILDVVGTAGHDFLQGQLTCDLRQITPSHMRSGALCNLQGRIVTLMDVIASNDALHLIVSHDLLKKTTRLLEKPALFSRVRLEPNLDYSVYGFAFNNPNDITPFSSILPANRFDVLTFDGGYCYNLGDDDYIFIIHNTHLTTFTAPFITHQRLESATAWHERCIRHHRWSINAASSELFLPHRLNLHQTDCISFNKGCYKGQEIIARMHYRATQKHTMTYSTITTNEALEPGLKLLHENNTTEIGELIDYCSIGENQYLIAISILINHPATGRLSGHKQTISLPN